MRSLYTRSFVTVLTLGLVILIGVGSSALGQGKGHGGDKGNRGQSGERGEGRQHADNPGQQKRQDRQEQRQERGQQENEGRNKHDNRPENNRIQQQQPEYRIEQGRGNGQWKQKDKRDERNDYPVYQQQRQGPPVWSNAWPNNYGQQRSSEVHARNAERKALKNQARTLGGDYDGRDYRQDRNIYDLRNTYNQRYSYDPRTTYNQPYAYVPRSTYDPRNFYQQRDSVRNNILRSVIGMVLGNNNNDTGSYYNTPQYNNYSYGIPYNPAYNGGGYYSPYQQYQNYGGAAPYYSNYQTNAYPYSSNYGGGPLYSNRGASQTVVPLLANLFGSRGGFVGRLISQLLASGYNQGYQDAQYARTNGYGNQYYQDPYAYQAASQPANAYSDIGYDPYSSLAENRQYLSEGYELGYRDALNTRNQSGLLGNSGGSDLISALLGSVLQSN